MRLSFALLGTSLVAGLAQAQIPASAPAPGAARSSTLGWQSCQALSANATQQLQCFKDWAETQTPGRSAPPALAIAPANPETGQKTAQVLLLPALNTEAPDGKPTGCRNDNYSQLSRFWELQRGSDCDTFALRGYRPISLSLVTSSNVNRQPSSPSTGFATPNPRDFSRQETKIELSVRTKLAKGLLKNGTEDADDQDSLWFGYSQKSYWQLFNAGLSRPFRSTDHEPEMVYIYPHQIALPGGWNYRLSGLGLVHQSNGQSTPLSRSWNRVYLMGAAEKSLGPISSLSVQGRLWQRINENAATDDNPDIQDFIGRAELAANWQMNKTDSLGLTVRSSLNSQSRGSTRIDWLVAPMGSPSYTQLRYHLQFFSGYGDSLLDYNRRRNVLSVGLSLVDW
ncbi:phospholipase A [Polaromonas vacuolata]|nr:phospholipase A [Polaromonas vacuolata]